MALFFRHVVALPDLHNCFSELVLKKHKWTTQSVDAFLNINWVDNKVNVCIRGQLVCCKVDRMLRLPWWCICSGKVGLRIWEEFYKMIFSYFSLEADCIGIDSFRSLLEWSLRRRWNVMTLCSVSHIFSSPLSALIEIHTQIGLACQNELKMQEKNIL